MERKREVRECKRMRKRRKEDEEVRTRGEEDEG